MRVMLASFLTRLVQDFRQAADNALANLYSQLANIYSARGHWDDCAGVLEYWDALIDIVRKLNLSPSRQYDLSMLVSSIMRVFWHTALTPAREMTQHGRSKPAPVQAN